MMMNGSRFKNTIQKCYVMFVQANSLSMSYVRGLRMYVEFCIGHFDVIKTFKTEKMLLQ